MGNKVGRRNRLESLLYLKLKWFQIRLLHRILATNIVLKEMGIAQKVLCNFCILERDSIQHCMWRCQHVKLFWNKLEGFICDHCNNVHNFKLNEKTILLGIDDNFKSDNVLDFIILYAKYLSIVADMKKSNLSCVYLERRWKKKKTRKKDTKLKHTTKKLKLTLPDFKLGLL